LDGRVYELPGHALIAEILMNENGHFGGRWSISSQKTVPRQFAIRGESSKVDFVLQRALDPLAPGLLIPWRQAGRDA
jgi:hypothetical protein